MTIPLISVLIDTYNHERYIEQAILSVVEQGLPSSEMEIVVVDDGSTDRTPEIVRKFEPRVRVIRKKNGGQASAFNAAIPETHGPIVAMLDGDDWWALGKVPSVLEVFEKNPEIAAVGHGFYEVRDDVCTRSVVPAVTCKLDVYNAPGFSITRRYFMGTSKLSVRRAALDRMMPIPEQLIFCADAPILTWALALGGTILLDKPLCFYRLHSENLFEFDSTDTSRLRARYEILEILNNVLSPKLFELGVSQEAIDTLLAEEWLDVERFFLSVNGGSRLRAFRAEKRAFEFVYKNPTAGYALFKWLVGALTLLLPPRRFYQFRRWYAQKNMSRLRARLGRAELSRGEDLLQAREVTPEELEKAWPWGKSFHGVQSWSS
jgi:glycosyltransferase involved in cell wall biosynthesis